MTEQEAIRWQEAFRKTYNGMPKEANEACDMAIAALEEIQQYRSIGTVEEIERMKRYQKLAKAHGTIGQVIEECVKYEAIGNVKECREAVEKQKAKKPIKDREQKKRYTSVYFCPTCGHGFTGTGIADHCYHCGQKLDWSEEDE